MSNGPYRNPGQVTPPSALDQIRELVSSRERLAKVRDKAANEILSWLVDAKLRGQGADFMMAPLDESGDDSIILAIGGRLGIPEIRICLSIVSVGRATDSANPLTIFLEMDGAASAIAHYHNGIFDMEMSSKPVVRPLTQESLLKAILDLLKEKGPYG